MLTMGAAIEAKGMNTVDDSEGTRVEGRGLCVKYMSVEDIGAEGMCV